MAIPLPDARQLPDEVLEALRLRALRGCELGFRQGDVAEMLGVAREAVSRWWSAYQACGLDGLPDDRTGRPPGSGRALTDDQAAHLQALLDEHSPAELGMAAPLGSRPAVRDLIQKESGVDLPVRTVGEYLKRWGYTAQRPSRHARDQDPEEVREWLEETYPFLEARATEEGATILWADETGVAADQHPRCGYARQGQRATMQVPDRHIRVNVLSAVSHDGDLHFLTYQGGLNAARFSGFLEQRVREAAGKVFAIVDNLSAHDGAAVDAWVAPRLGQIEVWYLPRRAPELNPDEYLNNDLKGNVHAAGLPHDEEELRSRVETSLDTLAHLPERIVSYFVHPCVQYAARL